MSYNELHKGLMGKKSKYEKYKVAGWDDSEGFLTEDQIKFLIKDELNNAQYFLESDYINSSPLTSEEKNYLSRCKAGEADLDNLGDFDFLKIDPK